MHAESGRFQRLTHNGAGGLDLGMCNEGAMAHVQCRHVVSLPICISLKVWMSAQRSTSLLASDAYRSTTFTIAPTYVITSSESHLNGLQNPRLIA